MDKLNHEKVFFNRATLSNELEHLYCENCFEELVFSMRDKEHEFSLGLTTVLKCLRFAENEGSVPKIPVEWWLAIERSYEMERIVQKE